MGDSTRCCVCGGAWHMATGDRVYCVGCYEGVCDGGALGGNENWLPDEALIDLWQEEAAARDAGRDMAAEDLDFVDAVMSALLIEM